MGYMQDGTYPGTSGPRQWHAASEPEVAPRPGSAASHLGSAPGAEATFLPEPSLPKCGGAIRAVGEKLSVNSAKGSCSVQVALLTSPARLSPEPALSDDSEAGNRGR